MPFSLASVYCLEEVISSAEHAETNESEFQNINVHRVDFAGKTIDS